MRQDTKSTRPIPLFKPQKRDGHASKEAPLGTLVVIQGDHLGEEYHLSPRKMLIGRTRRCDILIRDSSVSRKHASIERKDRRFLLQDLESTNGTLVNGELIDVRALHHGDEIRIGRTVLQFHNGTTQEDTPAKREKVLKQSSPERLKSKSFELDTLKANFLGWLQKSYPGDYERYANQPRIGESDIKDFLKSKGIDQPDIHYLLKSLRVR